MRFTMFAALAVLVLPAPALADVQDFVFINSTGRTVAELYVSPSKTNDWEEDVLGTDTLADGGRTTINFSGDSDACLYDIKLVHDDGDSATWNAIDLCKVSVVAASYDADGDPVARTE